MQLSKIRWEEVLEVIVMIKYYQLQLGSKLFNEMVSRVICYVNSVSAAFGSAGSFSAAGG